jgi:cytochrome c biogenesis protein CcmG, thiol:disulfide interchange protein DsbE
MRHLARWTALGVAVFVTGFAVVLATQIGGDPQADAKTSHLLGKAAPAYSVRTLDGGTATGDALSGKVVIVNFWNSWCIPCRAELPDLKDFYARHANDTDFAMVGIVRDDTARAVRSYVRSNGIKWTIGLDPGSQAALAFGTRGQPETFAITATGQIVAYQFGPVTEHGLDTMLNAARRLPA